MPLLVFILIVAVSISYLSSRYNKKPYEVERELRIEAEMRKTNMRLQQQLLDKYVRQGIDPQEAFEMSKNEVIELGFEPCWRHGYDRDGVFTTEITGDSKAVKTCAEAYKYWEIIYPNEPKPERLTDKAIYGHFPKTKSQYEWLEERVFSANLYLKVGTRVYHKELGTCEIIGRKYGYIIKSLKTGETREVPFTGNHISKL